MTAIINQMLVLLILIIVGYIAAKTGLMNSVSNERLTKVVMNLALPALILGAMTSIDGSSMQEAGLMLLASAVFHGLSIVLAFIVTRLLRVQRSEVSAYRFNMSYGNVAFMGYPVVAAVFGSDAMFYCALFNVPFNLAVYLVGPILLIKSSGSGKMELKRAINPPLITALFGLVLFFLGIRLPAVISSCADMLGSATTPMAMLIIGCSLAEMPLKELFTGWRLYIASLYKLIIMPIITWLIAIIFLPADSMVLKVLVLLAAMPVAANATMMTIEFGGNQQVAAKGIFFSTVLCVITIPVIVYLFLN